MVKANNEKLVKYKMKLSAPSRHGGEIKTNRRDTETQRGI